MSAPTTSEAEQLLQLFQEFFPKETASRWAKLLALKPERWSKIDPWKTWELLSSKQRGIKEWGHDVEKLSNSQPFSHYINSNIVALYCGHSSPAIKTIPLSQALCGEQAVFEGFVSIIPGALGLALNHDGGICVLSKQDI